MIETEPFLTIYKIKMGKNKGFYSFSTEKKGFP